MSPRTGRRGIVAWMAGHPVAANLLMLGLVVGGLVMAFRVKQEVFPEFTLDVVGISIPYPGASPEEVEEVGAVVHGGAQVEGALERWRCKRAIHYHVYAADGACGGRVSCDVGHLAVWVARCLEP